MYTSVKRVANVCVRGMTSSTAVCTPTSVRIDDDLDPVKPASPGRPPMKLEVQVRAVTVQAQSRQSVLEDDFHKYPQTMSRTGT